MFARTLLIRITRLCIGLRYRVSFHHEQKGCDRTRGTLFVCTHAAAFIETALIRHYLWRSHRPIHVASELLMHKVNLVSLIYRKFDEFLGSVYIPYFRNTTNSIKIARLNALVQKIADDLGQGKSYFAFPSGLNREVPYEELGANSLIHRVLQLNPEINIAYVRSTGFWGSVFSNAVAENQLEKNFFFMLKALIKGLGVLPKKSAAIDIKYEEQDLRHLERLELNRHVTEILNDCYPLNDQGRREEALNWVSYSYRGPQFLRRKPHVEDEEQPEEKSYDAPSHRIIREHIAQIASLPIDAITPDAVIADELGIDSIEIFGLMVFLQNQFNVEVASVERLHRVRDVYDVIAEHEEPGFAAEPFETSGYVSFPQADTLPEMFLRQVEQNHLGSLQDARLGGIDYGEMKKIVEKIYLSIRHYDGDKIGILLPQSTLFYCSLFALQIAQKVPVVLNYRSRALFGGDELRSLGVTVVLTSAAFVETQQATEFGADLDDKIVFLEEALFHKSLRKHFARLNLFLFDYARAKTDDTAVILFTSGSESRPKAVALSHKNIIAAMKGRYDFMQLTNDDLFLSILPSYHSMGLVASGLLPILTGVNVCFVSNPGNIGEIARLIKTLSPTILVLTPTLLTPLLEVDTAGLRKLRMVNTGSEPVPAALQALAEERGFGGNWVHGYGTTETASTLTLNPDFPADLSVGRHLTHAEIRIVDPHDYSVQRASGHTGLVLAASPATFAGYVGEVQSDKLVHVDGRLWLNTGDLGYLDPDGRLHLTDRLARTLKIGGEMISLAAVEETLANQFSPHDPQALVVTTAGEDSRLVLHTTLDVDAEALDRFLRQRLRNVVRIAEIRKVREIPRNESGKILFSQLSAANPTA